MIQARFLRLWVAVAAILGGCTDGISGKGGSPATPPAAPTNLAGLLQGGKTISLSWGDASGNESGFRIEVNTGPFGAPPYVGVFFVGANATGYDYAASLPNTAYHFRVYAITGSAQSDPSNEITLSTANFPLPPFYFTALATGPNTVDVKWFNGSSVTGNSVERSVDGTNWVQLFNNMTGPNQVVGAGDSGLSPNTVYYYRGFATNSAGKSDPTPIASTRTQAPVGGLMVAAASGPGVHSSLAFDDFLVHRIVSYNSWSATLSLTTGNFPPSPYSTSTIGFGAGNGYHGCSIATDNVGVNYVASHVYQSDQLQFLSNENGGVWQSLTIDSDPFFNYDIVGKAPVIRVSPTDQSIHVVYKVETTSGMGDGHLRHAWRAHAPGSAWSVETAVSYEPILDGHSFVIDSAGQLHVVYASRPGGAGPYMLKHVRRVSGGGWTFSIITQEGQPDLNSVTVGPSNSLHVAYKDVSIGGLMYATDRSGSWTTEQVHVHTGGNIGRHNSITYFSTATADVHISYYEVTNGNLWYAGKKGANGVWNLKLIDSAGDVGRYTSIGKDGTDLYITYFDFTNSYLKIIRNPQD
jgi:hypothetical protein